MNILDALKQLRDDIKIWVTNNLNALNAKIDEKTIPIDKELSATSTNPVQNKTITNAINNIPRFSGSYNDLTDAPNIAEDGSGNMVIADESGNIIFKADADGIHTTAVSLNGEAAASEKYVDEAIANIDIPDVDFTGYATETYVAEEIAKIPKTDLTGYATEKYVGEAIDAIPEADFTGYATENFVDTAIDSAKEELSESIVAESSEWKVVDEAGNIVFSVDAAGAHTTELTLNGESAATESYVNDAIANIEFPATDLTGYATEQWVENKNYLTEHQDISGKSDIEHKHVLADITDLPDYATTDYVDTKVADLVNSAPETLNTLGELATALETHEDAYDALLETVGSKATQTDLENLREELSESIVAESDEWKVVDAAGNIIFSVDAEGAHTTELTLNGEGLKDLLDEKASKEHSHQIKNNSQVSTTGTTIAFEIEGQTFSQEVAIDGGSMSVESAQKLTTGRSISLSGDVVAEGVLFDGSSDIILTASVKNSEKLANKAASEYALKTDIPDTKDFITISDVEEKHYLVEADITAKKFVDESSLAAKQYATESFVADELEGLTEDLKQSILLESKEWQVVDENNNIIFKVDAEGTHTTAVTINGEVAATESYVNEAVKNVKVDLTDYPTRSEVEDMLPTDYLTEEILGTKGLATETYVDSAVEGLASETYVDNAVEGIATELKQSILLESQDWQVVDSNNNVILSVDSDGLHTTSMTLDGESAATEKFVADSIAAIEFPETDLSNYYTKQETEALIPDVSEFITAIPENYITEETLETKGFLTEHQSLEGLATVAEVEAHTTDTAIHVSAADKQKWNAKSNFSGDYNDLENAPNIAEDDSGDLVIADANGNVIFRSNGSGFETVNLIVQNLTINGMTIQEMIKAYVDEVLKSDNNE